MLHVHVHDMTCRTVGQPVASRPGDIRHQSQSPSTSPRSVASHDSLDAAVRSHSSFTKYLGGKFLSLFTVTVFISSLALIGLSATSFVLYRDQGMTNMMRYISEITVPKYAQELESFISTSTRIQGLLLDGADFETITSSFGSVTSILRVHHGQFDSFTIAPLEAGGVSYRSNASDCSTSTVYSCTDEVDQADADSFISKFPLLTSELTLNDYLLANPNYLLNSSSHVATQIIDRIFKATTDGSFYRLRLRMDDMYFNFSSDSFLNTNDGYGGVMLLNKANGAIISALGIPSQNLTVVPPEGENTQQVSGVTISAPDASLRMPGWVSELSEAITATFSSNSTATPVWFESADSRAFMTQIPTTPFALIAGSTVEQSVFRDERLYWVLVASLIVAIFPVVGTFLIGSAYSLRLVAVRRRKQMRAIELRDAEVAILAIKESRLRKQGSVVQKR